MEKFKILLGVAAILFSSVSYSKIIKYEISGGGVPGALQSLDGLNEFSYDFSGNMYVDNTDLFYNPPYDGSIEYFNYLDFIQHVYSIPVFDLTVTVKEPGGDVTYNILDSTSLHLQENLDVSFDVHTENGLIVFIQEFMTTIGDWHVPDYVFEPDQFLLSSENMDTFFGDDYLTYRHYSDIMLTKVSEPSTILLMTVGLVGLGYSGRKRRSKQSNL